MKESETADSPTGVVIACAAEGYRRRHVFAAALAECRTRRARLVLYDIDAASTWVTAIPAREDGHYGDPLTAGELRRLGRPELAEQVESAEGMGIAAFGWLPSQASADAMVDYASRHGAAMVMLSKELESPGFVQRLHHLTAERALAAAGAAIEIRLVAGDEGWEPEHDMSPVAVNALDAGVSRAVGGAHRASALLTATGALAVAAAFVVAGSVVFLGVPIVLLAVALVVGAIGAGLLLSARSRRPS
ncbi:MAG: hypothetical protein NVS9B1_17710 [Candidatus Dormibacteraceae bacterium]